eukprot:scaffold189661_cov33-Tisochrysis_lutea.AAC.1
MGEVLGRHALRPCTWRVASLSAKLAMSEPRASKASLCCCAVLGLLLAARTLPLPGLLPVWRLLAVLLWASIRAWPPASSSCRDAGEPAWPAGAGAGRPEVFPASLVSTVGRAASSARTASVRCGHRRRQSLPPIRHRPPPTRAPHGARCAVVRAASPSTGRGRPQRADFLRGST